MPRTLHALLAGLVVLPMLGCGDGGPTPPSGPRRPVLGPTTFIDPDIITATDSSAFTGVVANGQGSRTMFDRRADAEVTVDAWLFDASYDDGLSTEIQVNPEFADTVAAALAEQFGRSLGRLPNVLRAGVEEIWVHDGVEEFGAFDGALLIHAGQAVAYFNDSFLEEVLAHQAVHVSLDPAHATSAGWIEAQELDNGFISQNAEDAPTTEDVAESFIPYLAVVWGTAV